MRFSTHPGLPNSPYDELCRAADLALLRAKREGRDRVVAAAEPRAVVAA